MNAAEREQRYSARALPYDAALDAQPEAQEAQNDASLAVTLSLGLLCVADVTTIQAQSATPTPVAYLTGIGPDFNYSLPPYSITVLRIQP